MKSANDKIGGEGTKPGLSSFFSPLYDELTENSAQWQVEAIIRAGAIWSGRTQRKEVTRTTTGGLSGAAAALG
jgi:hypothetical protein